MDYQRINKKNLPKWIDTLKYLTNILNKNNIKYYLSASGLEYILGSNIYPYDIDIFTSRDDVKKAYKLIKKHSVSNLHYCEEDGRSLLEFQGIYNNIPFEICEWEKKPKNFKIVKFEGIEISILE